MFDAATLQAIGGISVNFQRLEMSLSLIAWGLLNEDAKIGQIVTPLLSFSKLCDLVSSLGRHRWGSESEIVRELDSLIKRAATLEEDRNRIIHSFWYMTAGEDTSAVGRMKLTSNRKRGFSVQDEVANLPQLLELATALETLKDDFGKLRIIPHPDLEDR